MLIQEADFRQVVGAYLERRFDSALARGEGLDPDAFGQAQCGQAVEAVLWLERYHHCGLDYLLREDAAFMPLAGRKVTLSSEGEKALILDAHGLPLTYAAEWALHGAYERAAKKGLGLGVIQNVRDVAALGAVLDRALVADCGFVGTWFLGTENSLGRDAEAMKREADTLSTLLSCGRALSVFPFEEKDTAEKDLYRVDCQSLVLAHLRSIRGVTPQKMGDLVEFSFKPHVNAVPNGISGVAILSIDLPEQRKALALAFELAAQRAPARLLKKRELRAMQKRWQEEGYQIDNLLWERIQKAVPAAEGGASSNVIIPETAPERSFPS